MGSIHVKLEYNEAINIKREALMLEEELLETISHIRNYNNLRKKEFLIKNQLKKDLIFLQNHIQLIQNHLPIHELGSMARKQEYQQNTSSIINQVVRREKSAIQGESKNKDIEQELKEIREKLARLG